MVLARGGAFRRQFAARIWQTSLQLAGQDDSNGREACPPGFRGCGLLTVGQRSGIFPSMTAIQIIREIDSLPPLELAKVVRHAKELDKRRPLTGAELTELAQRMVDAPDTAEADRLQEALVKGFYGEQ